MTGPGCTGLSDDFEELSDEIAQPSTENIQAPPETLISEKADISEEFRILLCNTQYRGLTPHSVHEQQESPVGKITTSSQILSDHSVLDSDLYEDAEEDKL